MKKTFASITIAGVALLLGASSGKADVHLYPKDADHEMREAQTQWHLALEAGLSMPLSAGAWLTVTSPFGLRIQTGFGGMPGVFIEVVNGVGRGLGLLKERTAELIETSVAGGFSWNLEVGGHPMADEGLYLVAGYGLLGLSGGFDSASLYDMGAGELSADAASGPENNVAYGVESLVHMVRIEVGWEFVIQQSLVIKLGVGAAFTVAAQTRASAHTQEDPSSGMATEAEVFLQDVYTRYVHTPTINLAVGYRFF